MNIKLGLINPSIVPDEYAKRVLKHKYIFVKFKRNANDSSTNFMFLYFDFLITFFLKTIQYIYLKFQLLLNFFLNNYITK